MAKAIDEILADEDMEDAEAIQRAKEARTVWRTSLSSDASVPVRSSSVICSSRAYLAKQGYQLPEKPMAGDSFLSLLHQGFGTLAVFLVHLPC